MKKFLVVFFVLLGASVSAVAQQLTKADIQSLETNMTKLQETVTDIDKRLTRLEVTVTEMEKRLSNQITALNTFVQWAICVLFLIVFAVIALPQIFGYLREKKERQDFQKRLEKLEQELAQSKTRIIAP